MSTRVNDDVVLWCVAVLQPAAASDVMLMIVEMFPEVGRELDVGLIADSIHSLEARGHVMAVHQGAGFYSATAKANTRLSKRLRVQRDSARLFLMPRRAGGTFRRSGESVIQDLGGASPSNDDRSDAKQAARPISSSSELRVAKLLGRAYRPRIIQQLELSVGSGIDSPDVHLRYGSFATLSQVHTAAGRPSDRADISLSELGLCIGITPALLRSIILHKRRHYRSFELPKKSGGIRRIDAPRTFLKSVQRWIADYLLIWLPIHTACHAYLPGRSIVSNADSHIGKSFVGIVDIENFFGSVRKPAVARVLDRAGFGPSLSSVVATLCTLDGNLPQGAPTSPQISNSFLFDFDTSIFDLAEKAGVSYTRYADDITLSGNDHATVLGLVDDVAAQLREFGLRLRLDKTRILSQQAQQRVTGIVVNQKGYPPRMFRRRVRAEFHQADCRGVATRDQYKRLRGLVAYLSQFPEIRSSAEITKYRSILDRLAVIEQAK